MEDFFYAGGLPRAAGQPRRPARHLGAHGQRPHARGEHRRRQGLQRRRDPHRETTRWSRTTRLAVLRGNLAPDGAVIKPSAAEARLHRHTGPAVVFENYDDMAARIDDPDLDVDENSVLVLRNAGPQGAPGMPEWGQLPIPKKLLEQGVRDMVRISDARMSGTSYGACVLHVAPERHVGGPLALVRDRRPDRARRRRRRRLDAAGRRRGAGEAPRPTGSSRRRSTAAATARCTCSTSPRPTRAATSTSWRPGSRSRSRRSTEWY